MASADRTAASAAGVAANAALSPSRYTIPGEDVTEDLLSICDTGLRLGNGLAQADDAVVVTKAGLMNHRAPNRFFVVNSQRRYVPAVGDTVVGTVVDRMTEFYRVQLHGTGIAQLPILAFDGATKRNKPNLAIGANVFARVAVCNRHLDAELTCQAGGTAPKKDWMTGQSVYGELKGGTVIHVSTGLARRLLDPECAILTALGAGVPFEIAVGVNGTVWVQAASGACVGSALSRRAACTPSLPAAHLARLSTLCTPCPTRSETHGSRVRCHLPQRIPHRRPGGIASATRARYRHGRVRASESQLIGWLAIMLDWGYASTKDCMPRDPVKLCVILFNYL